LRELAPGHFSACHYAETFRTQTGQEEGGK
jgi:hypothetical protein